MTRLTRKIAMVTGGASGLGRAIAQRLASDGATVVITDRQQELGRVVAAEFGFEFYEQDVCREESWTSIMCEIEARHARLDVLVNNAGVLGPTDAASPESTRLVDWKVVFGVNVEGTFLGCRAAIALMRRTGGGSIVNISSIAGLMATPYATAYGASKAAVRHLTKSVAQHCAQQGLKIRCNSVHPGTVRTSLWNLHAEEVARERGVSLDEIIVESQREIPLGDFTKAEDVAAAVSFLASDDARHMTGAKLIVDGGVVNCATYRASSAISQPQA